MTSSGSSHLKDIDEKFCQCSICLQQYREPKQLPCLHRYCSDCLKQLIERNQIATKIKCPECRHAVEIPKEGIDGFKTDFYMKNIIEYIQLQKSLQDEKLRECCDCSIKSNVTSFCFKCNGLLCEECYKIHMMNQSLKEHKQHVLSLEDLKSKHMTVEKLADLKEAPRCQSHLNDLCLLCCRTCNELPICVTCVHGRHKNHDINDVEIIATEEREKLKNKMQNLNQYQGQILKMPQEVDRVKGDVTCNFREMRESFTTRYQRDKQNLKMETAKIEEDYNSRQAEIMNNKEKDLTEARKQMEEDMTQIKIKYDNVFDEIEKKSKLELANCKEVKDEKLGTNSEKVAILERKFERSMDTFAKEQEERLAKLEVISQHILGITGRYENLTVFGNSVLETRNDWTAVQCIPDICKAVEPLIGDMKKGFSDLGEFSTVGLSFEIKEDEGSPVNIEGIETDDCSIDGVTGVSDGSIVITGRTSEDYQSHITVINMNGQVIHREEQTGTHREAYRYCAYLPEFKVATVCWRDEIGVFDVRDCSYITKNISDVIISWPLDQSVSCVAADSVNNHILVGRHECKDVYVFDDQLNYHHTLTLPEMIYSPRDMALSEGKLLVCDMTSKKAYVVTMEGQVENKGHVGKITLELTGPDCDRDDWGPLSVCTDRNGLIYILWITGNRPSAGRKVIVQYTQDGKQLQIQNQISLKDARCMVTVNTNMTEKLLVASWNSGKLHIYKIMSTELL